MLSRILLILFFLLGGVANAATVTVDPSGWTQEQKNMTKAMVVRVLSSQDITYKDVEVKLPEIDVVEPSSPLSAVNQQAIETAYQSWRTEIEAADLELAQELNSRKAEYENSQLKDMKLSQIDTWIDTQVDQINNLADAKTFLKAFLKKLVRYVKSREL